MKTIKEILQVDLSEDIKHVIDLEDQSETQIQSEIASYIVTDNLGDYFYKFMTNFTSEPKETGVWISGFYGSGKSYFGKMLGYLLANRLVNGTTARERFLPRLIGVNNESLIRSEILKLDGFQTRVIFLDIAKQNTENGLAWVLFKCFLQSLGFEDSVYGFIEFTLLLEGEYDRFCDAVKKVKGKEWAELKRNIALVPSGMRAGLLDWKYSEKEFDDVRDLLNATIDSFAADKLRDQLKAYLVKFPDEKIVFLFDEASEAISQGKFKLLDLEGLSESLSSLYKNVWTVAIAQEKLDDVINSASVSKAQLTKVTDRFNRKIHLEATEVDVIIRNRLLQKKPGAKEKLEAYYKSHSGMISDHSTLGSSGVVKTNTLDLFVDYYPFHKYQFDLLQNFLFGSRAVATSKGAARGMIKTTFDVLRNQIKEKQLFDFATSFQICHEAQSSPDSWLVNRYDNATRMLKEKKLELDGRKLMETINFLTGVEVVAVTRENITKAYISQPEHFHSTSDTIQKALDELVERQQLIVTDQKYRITSDQEQRMIEQMNAYQIQGYQKRNELIGVLKKHAVIKSLSPFHDSGIDFPFSLISDQGEELNSGGAKEMRVVFHSLYYMDTDSATIVERVKRDTQNEKGRISVVPDNEHFPIVDRLIEEILKLRALVENSGNADDDTRRILRNFQAIQSEKEKELVRLVDEAYTRSTAVYLFNSHRLRPESFKAELADLERQCIKNIYWKRLKSQLSDGIAEKVVMERDATRLRQYFSGEEFNYFDDKGNFVGQSMPVAEEILSRTKNMFLDGKMLETDLSGDPWGYTYGSIVTTVAALFRGAKLIVKFNGAEKYSYQDAGVVEVFKNIHNFRKASFKALSRSISAAQRKEIVDALHELKIEDHGLKKVDWNTNDFELMTAVKEMASRFIAKVEDFAKTVPDFQSVFKGLDESKGLLQDYTANVTEGNYLSKAEEYLASKVEYATAIQRIVKAEKFIEKNLAKVNQYKRFAAQVKRELENAALPSVSFEKAHQAFLEAWDVDVVGKFGPLQDLAQKIKDEYFVLITKANADMSTAYTPIVADSEALIAKIGTLPAGLNGDNLRKADAVLAYAQKRVNPKVVIEYDVKCTQCGFSVSEMISYTALAKDKAVELTILDASLVLTAPAPTPPTPKGDETPASTPEAPKPTAQKVRVKVPTGKIKAGAYRSWLTSEMRNIAGTADDQDLEIDIE